MYEALIPQALKEFGADHRQYLIVRALWAGLLSAVGRYDEAVPLRCQILEAR